jgi:transcription initiation factor IIE alpha subunit
MGIDEYIRWEAIEEEKERIVKNLLKGSDLSDEKIASLVEVTVEFVNEVKADLKVH